MHPRRLFLPTPVLYDSQPQDLGAIASKPEVHPLHLQALEMYSYKMTD